MDHWAWYQVLTAYSLFLLAALAMTMPRIFTEKHKVLWLAGIALPVAIFFFLSKGHFFA